MNRTQQLAHCRELHRTAFTLVEMLVSTALVMLIMMMFAQIYGSTVQTITLQRGIGNNDQKARALNTIILNDLRAMTYRQASLPFGAAKGIVPFAPGQAVDQIDSDRQKGYFYYSENDPRDDTDDVLQFTAMIATAATAGDTSADSSQVFMGKSANLPNNGALIASNQPDLDDKLIGNDQSQSRAAEICYFLRGGNLYRRVLLLRDSPTGATSTDAQPAYSDGTRIFGPDGGAGSVRTYSNFYQDFDYSATRIYDDASSASGSYLWFNSVQSLNAGDPHAIAQPWNRFGHYNNPRSGTAVPADVDHGCPREFELSTNPDSQFIGRYTSEETSSSGMGWPGQETNSMKRSVNAPLNTSTYVVSDFSGGPRIAEDLLLTNVEAFDVQYYDDNLGIYTSLETQVSSSLPANSWQKNQNPYYGPLRYSGTGAVNNNVFDTWHPDAFSVISPSTTMNAEAPLRPMVSTGTAYDTWADLPAPPVMINVGDRVAITGGSPNPSFVYKVIRQGVRGNSATDFPLSIGNVVQEDDGGAGNGAIWQCIDNRVGLKSIQIVIRYRDPSKGLAKQVTLVHSFVE